MLLQITLFYIDFFHVDDTQGLILALHGGFTPGNMREPKYIPEIDPGLALSVTPGSVSPPELVIPCNSDLLLFTLKSLASSQLHFFLETNCTFKAYMSTVP